MMNERGKSDSSAAYWNYASYLVAIGRFDDAIRTMDEALRIDPLNAYAHAVQGWIYFMAGRYDQATEHLERVVTDRFPDLMEGYVLLAWSYAAKGMFGNALNAAPKAMVALGEDPWLRASLAAVHVFAGENLEARRTLVELERIADRRYIDPRNFAVLFGALGDTTRALAELELAFELRSPEMVFLRAGTFIHMPITSSPRYAALATFAGSAVANVIVVATAVLTSDTRFFRGAAFGRWPPRARKSVSVKGGGQPFAALTVGSRAFGKR